MRSDLESEVARNPPASVADHLHVGNREKAEGLAAFAAHKDEVTKGFREAERRRVGSRLLVNGRRDLSRSGEQIVEATLAD